MQKTLIEKPILTLNQISINFGDFQAIKNVSTTIYKNKIHFFIGPNGAGKTTILDAICGKNKISTGSITYLLNNHQYQIEKMSDYEIFRYGIGRKFQTPSIFNGLTIFENISIAVTKNHSVINSLYAKLTTKQRTTIEEVLHFIGLTKLQNEYPLILSHGQKQWLEIGLLMAAKPKLILLDEPVAGMGRKETDKTEELLLELKKHCAIICVEHDMKFCQDIADSVTVFHEGQILDEGTFDKVQNNPQVISVYLGRSHE